MVFSKKIVIGIMALGLLSCGPSAKLSEVTPAEKEALERLVENGKMEFQGKWARPLATASMNRIANAGLLQPGDNPSRINITGSTAFVRILKDSVSGRLPYYGERQAGAGPGTANSGIRFDGTPKNLKITQDAKTQGYKVSFTINNGTENFDVSTLISPKMQATVNVNSNQRRTISYTGDMSALE